MRALIRVTLKLMSNPMHGGDGLHGLDLNDYLVLHYQVRVKPGIDANRLVDHGNAC